MLIYLHLSIIAVQQHNSSLTSSLETKSSATREISEAKSLSEPSKPIAVHPSSCACVSSIGKETSQLAFSSCQGELISAIVLPLLLIIIILFMTLVVIVLFYYIVRRKGVRCDFIIIMQHAFLYKSILHYTLGLKQRKMLVIHECMTLQLQGIQN